MIVMIAARQQQSDFTKARPDTIGEREREREKERDRERKREQ
jgi:hypothetical protein